MSPEPSLAYALNLAYRRLSRRDYSEKEIALLFGRKGIPDNLAAEAIRLLKSRGHLDDERYLKLRVETLAVNRRWGSRKIVHELQRQGFEEHHIQEALRSLPERDELTSLRSELNKINKDAPWDVKAKARFFRRQAARGFAPGDILMVMDEVKERDGNDLDR